MVEKIDFELINKIRNKKGKSKTTRYWISILAGLSIILLFIFKIEPNEYSVGIILGAGFIGVVCAAVLLHFLTKPIDRDYKKQLKKHVVDKIIDELGLNLNYDSNSKLSKDEFKNSKLIDLAYCRYDSSDLFRGATDNLSFIFSEISITPRHEGKLPISGIYFRFDFNMEKEFVLDFVEANSGLLNTLNSTPGFRMATQKVDIPNMADGKSVFTNNIDLTRSLFSNDFFSNLKNSILQEHEELYFSLRNGQLHIFVKTARDFIKIDYDLEIENQIDQYVNDIQFLYSSGNKFKSFFEPYIQKMI